MIFFAFSCVATLPQEEWSWSGNLFERSIEGFLPLQNATIQVYTQDLELLVETEENPDSPYRTLEISEEYREQELIFLLNGDNCHQSLWKGTAPPEGDVIWLNGSLFAQGKSYHQLILNSLGLLEVEPLTDPITQEASSYSLLWGEPADAEDWTGVSVSAVLHLEEPPLEDTSSESGNPIVLDPLLFSQTEEGLLIPISSPITEELPLSLFIIPEVPSGTLELTLSRTSDLGPSFETTTTYPSMPGTWLSAVYFTIPSE
ncbi:MAG: hypothetical protein CMK59_10460 [Proteobacteria bacterium]|nr:hypothetical protein [Pseudomonadota bacterium]